MTDPDVPSAGLYVPAAGLDVPPANSDGSAADPDSAAGTGPASAVDGAPSGVVLAEESPEPTAPVRPTEAAAPSGAMRAEEIPEAATRAMPADGTPGADSPGQPPLGDSLRAQVARLDELDELPVAAHIERYEAVHNELHAALRGIHDPGG